MDAENKLNFVERILDKIPWVRELTIGMRVLAQNASTAKAIPGYRKLRLSLYTLRIAIFLPLLPLYAVAFLVGLTSVLMEQASDLLREFGSSLVELIYKIKTTMPVMSHMTRKHDQLEARSNRFVTTFFKWKQTRERWQTKWIKYEEWSKGKDDDEA